MMKEEIQALLEDILVAETLILSELIRQNKERSGIKRIGGDYTAEAVNEIKRSRQKVIALLRQ
jgi:hypothetical protein